jgi:hypothetical protein
MASFSFMFYWELINFGNLQLPEPFEIIEWRDFIFCGACRIAGLPLKAAGLRELLRVLRMLPLKQHESFSLCAQWSAVTPASAHCVCA